MPKPETTSSELKKIFAQAGGGDEKDWKRVSKKKNEAGQWVRCFENKKSGVALEVVELGEGRFKARMITAEQTKLEPAVKNKDEGLTPSMENDPRKIEAAETVLQALQDYDADVEPQLIKKAGKALANQFNFAVGKDAGTGLYAVVSPRGVDGWDQHLQHLVDHLMPSKGREVIESTFDFSDYASPEKLIRDLQKCGFVWDWKFQKDVDSQTNTDILGSVGLRPITAPSSVPYKN